MTHHSDTAAAFAPRPRLSADADAQMWSEVGAEWIEQSRDQIWRRYSDQVTSKLITDWLPGDLATVLKTDLFDEAVSAGLYPTLRDLAQTVHGIDVAAETVNAVRRKYPMMQTHLADVRRLPFSAATIDTVVSTSTLDHFENAADIDVSLHEFRRVLRDGGRLLITLDNPLNPKIALRAALPETLLIKAGLVPYHCGVTLNRRDLRRAIERAGFTIRRESAFLHCPRVTAVKLAAVLDRLSGAKCEDTLLSTLQRFERLERWPSRWRTGHFTAVLAQAC